MSVFVKTLEDGISVRVTLSGGGKGDEVIGIQFYPYEGDTRCTDYTPKIVEELGQNLFERLKNVGIGEDMSRRVRSLPNSDLNEMATYHATNKLLTGEALEKKVVDVLKELGFEQSKIEQVQRPLQAHDRKLEQQLRGVLRRRMNEKQVDATIQEVIQTTDILKPRSPNILGRS